MEKIGLTAVKVSSPIFIVIPITEGFAARNTGRGFRVALRSVNASLEDLNKALGKS